MKKYSIGITVGTIFFIALGSWTVQQFTSRDRGGQGSQHPFAHGGLYRLGQLPQMP